MKQRYKAFPLLVILLVTFWTIFKPIHPKDTALVLFWIIPGAFLITGLFCWIELRCKIAVFPLDRQTSICVSKCACECITKISCSRATEYQVATPIGLNAVQRATADLGVKFGLDDDVAEPYILWAYASSNIYRFTTGVQKRINLNWMNLKVIEHHWGRR